VRYQTKKRRKTMTKIFRTRKEARKELDALVGWPKAKISRLNLGPNGEPMFVLECAPGKYMGEEGYIQ
jgi:hypothetical protein